ncbi:peptidoglycan DD-metalloendopeptidase family protein [Streptomyces coelicoflavus]|uniref:Peptidoglycan DD-metalloendopeptidase family protein n=1 Tax=Streptomyces coelicoflavus TaxID=285562 RepID=A0A6N9UHH2_9ACTN|nr:peptidoglycan DD-metalloendopeptidase family protein [Streptomyces coelicoflavus]
MNDERLTVAQAADGTGAPRPDISEPGRADRGVLPEQPEQPEPPRKRKRRSPGPVTLLLLPAFVTVTGVAAFLALGGLPGQATDDDSAADPSAAVDIDPSYIPWLRKAASACTVLEPSVLAAQIDQLSGWSDDSDELSGQKGIAAFTDDEWRTWGKDDDGNGRSSPRDPADAIMALGRRDCSLAGTVTELRTEGRINGDLVELTLAAYAAGPDAVTEAGRVPSTARTYLDEVQALLPRYEALDREDSGSAGGTAGALLTAPVSPLTITSPFGSREHPLTGVTKLHTGVDFAAPQGAQVVAARRGRVVFAALTSAYGNRIVIDHGTIQGKRVETTYSHLSSLGTAVGQTVEAGAPIGRVGSTGLSTGPHLHFEVVLDGYYTDPRPWVVPDGV